MLFRGHGRRSNPHFHTRPNPFPVRGRHIDDSLESLYGTSGPVETEQRLPRRNDITFLGHDLDDAAVEGRDDLGHVPHLAFELLQFRHGIGNLVFACLERSGVPRLHGHLLES